MSPQLAPHRPAVAAMALVAVLALALPTPRARAAGNTVADGNGSAAVIGVVTRIPAEITGGALYASSAVTLDKARARASGFYGGELVDAFLRSSLEEYGLLIDELDATAENPQQSSPDEEVVGNSVDGPAHAGRLHAATPSRTEAEASFTVASDAGDDAPVLFDASTAESRTRVLDDGTVVTESVATVTGLVVAGVVEFGTIRSVARASVPVDGEPETELETTISGVTVAGTEVLGLGEDGITIAGQQVLGDLKLTELDPVFEALAEQGLTFESVPGRIEAESGRASVEGAALRFRYEAKKDPTLGQLLSDNPLYQVVPLPPELGYDEEFLIGHVRANAVARASGDLGIDLGFGDGASPTGPDTDASPDPAPSSTPDVGTSEAPDTTPRPSGTATLATDSTPADDGGAAPEPPEVAAPAGGTDQDGTAPGSGELELVGAGPVDPGVQRVVDAYQLLFLFALGGAAAPRLLRTVRS